MTHDGMWSLGVGGCDVLDDVERCTQTCLHEEQSEVGYVEDDTYYQEVDVYQQVSDYCHRWQGIGLLADSKHSHSQIAYVDGY